MSAHLLRISFIVYFRFDGHTLSFMILLLYYYLPQYTVVDSDNFHPQFMRWLYFVYRLDFLQLDLILWVDFGYFSLFLMFSSFLRL